ncbi:MAG: sigma factor-like helix-turn-helix DNA-binding protein [Vicinamibacterales bacterium]
MKDLRLELRVRNNVLWHAIFDEFPTVAAFCRRHGFEQTAVGALLNLTGRPYLVRRRADGHNELLVASLARRLCELSGYSAEYLFPPVLYANVVSPRTAVELEAATMLPLLAARDRLAIDAGPDERFDEADCRAVLARALSSLPPRQRQAVTLRFGLDGDGERTYRQMGESMGITVEGCRRLEMAALRRLRHPSRARELRDYVV